MFVQILHVSYIFLLDFFFKDKALDFMEPRPLHISTRNKTALIESGSNILYVCDILCKTDPRNLLGNYSKWKRKGMLGKYCTPGQRKQQLCEKPIVFC